MQFGAAAQRDADQQYRYLAGQSIDLADRFDQFLQATIERLATNPESGTQWEFDDPDREPLYYKKAGRFKNHLIFYRLHEDRLEVVRVLHAARDIAGILEHEPF